MHGSTQSSSGEPTRPRGHIAHLRAVVPTSLDECSGGPPQSQPARDPSPTRLVRERTIQLLETATRQLSRDRKAELTQERLARFREIHGVDADTVQRQAWAVAGRIGVRRRSCVLHPEKRARHFLRIWDTVTALALVYTATITPFETAFLPATLGPAAWADPWFIINRVLDGVFFCDMVLQVFAHR